MRSIAIAGLLVLAAQAEVICTQHRGCFETGLKSFATAGPIVDWGTSTTATVRRTLLSTRSQSSRRASSGNIGDVTGRCFSVYGPHIRI